jgi:RHS repeat-associated protein
MADWSVLDRTDPAPGTPAGVRQLARRLQDEARRVQDAVSRLQGVANGTDTLRMAGDYAAGYRTALAELPPELRRLDRAYGAAGTALDRFAGSLEEARTRAATALNRGTDADSRYQGALNELRALLPDGRQAVLLGGVNLNSWTLDTATLGLDESVRAQVRSAGARARSADDDLDAARRLADEAARLRADAERRCEQELDDAGDPIADKPWYEKAWDVVSAPFRSWDAFVDLCRDVALVVGVVALFVSGPLGWALVAVAVAAAAVAFSDDVGRYARGEIGLGELGLSALGVIPFAPGAVRVAQLGSRLAAMGRGLRAGGGSLLSAAGRAARGTIPAIRDGIGNLRTAAGDLGRNAWRFVTDPIDPVTGDVLIAQEDLCRDGVLPVLLERAHRSSYRSGRCFGPSWASTLDQRVEVDGDRAFVALADGALLVFPVPEPGGAAVEPEHGPVLHLAVAPGGAWTLTDPRTDRMLHFAATGSPDPGVFPLQRITDPHGNAVELGYDGDRLVEVRHSAGDRVRIETEAGLVTALLADDGTGTEVPVRRFGYDAARRLTHVQDADGVPQVFDYDPVGRVVRWQDRIGTWYRYTYDTQGRAVSTQGVDHCMDATLEYGERTRRWTNSLGQVTTYRVEDGQPVRITDPLGNVTALRWDDRDRLLERTDPLGHTTTYTYDEHGEITTVVRPDGSRCEIDHAAPGRPRRVREPDGAESRWVFDDRGLVRAAVDAGGATTSYRYDAHGAVTAVTDPTGAVARVRNDAAGLPVEVTDPLGAVTRIRRDTWGRIVAVTDPTGGTTTYSWTVDGRLSGRTTPDGATERWRHDGEGNLVEHVDAMGGITRFEIGHFDTTSARTTPDGARTALVYDTELRPVALVDARGFRWRYEYDAAGRVVRETDYDGRVLTYRYDAAGRLVERVNGAGESVGLTRDVLGRVVAEHAGDQLTSYTYDAADRLLRAVNADADLAFDYDPAGRVVAEACDGRVVASTYDPAGRRLTRRTPSGLRSSWAYDPVGRPVSLVGGSGSLTFTWDPAGREVERGLGATTLRQEWDPASRLVAQSLTGEEDSRSRRFTYRPDGYLTRSGDRHLDLDAVGRVLAVTSGGHRETYRYDAAGGITAATGPFGAEAVGDREFAGSRVRRARRVHYEYDAQGRLTLRRVRLLSGGTREWHFTWDALDRLVGVTTPDGDRWRYRHDALGRRVAKERLDPDGRAVRRITFTWDGLSLAEQNCAGHGLGWDWDPEGLTPLVQHEWDDPQEVDRRFHAIVADLVGTPTELVDPTGRVQPVRTSLWGTAVGPSPTPLRFPGQYADEESGLHHNLFRYYDPATGDYVSPDPLGLAAGVNHRHYVVNPLHWLDPWGLSPCGRNARLLGGNMAREGRPVAAGQAPAHIVASGGTYRQWAPAAQARQILGRYGVDINDAVNGIRLGHPRPHNFTHHGPFHERVRDSLANVVQGMQDAGRGARAIRGALRDELRRIGREVEAELAGGVPGPGAVWTAP